MTIAHSQQNICYASQVAFTSIRIKLARRIKNTRAPRQTRLFVNFADLDAPTFRVPRQNRQRCASPSAMQGDTLTMLAKSQSCHEYFHTESYISTSKIKATGANWLESKIIRLDGKGVIMQRSILLGDRDHKLVILHDHRHDVSQR